MRIQALSLVAQMSLNKQKVGRLGRISKDWIDSMGLDLEKAYGFEIDLEPIKQMLDKERLSKDHSLSKKL